MLFLPETVQLLDKVNESIYHSNHMKTPLYSWPASALKDKILRHMTYFTNICQQENFESIKHALICQLLRESDISSLEVTYTFSPTIFGQLYENFWWKFEIESHDEPHKTMKNDIDKKVAEFQINNEKYNEVPGALRYNSIVQQEKHIKSIFNYLSDSLTDLDDEKLATLCSVILFDLERMSLYRQYNFLSYQRMMSTKNPNDKWMTCLMIDAIYKKPTIILENNKAMIEK